MTIDEAIEIGTTLNHPMQSKINMEEWEAIQLLIEAGKRLAFNRLNTIASSDELLPGETE
ncbi:hypothetical protein LCGC14_1609170 [marine sediment metagenome]|uniref:Uncharacterized protein n=1 Tax=marine sediment metagenome TaxID=412755 RepID=A0A0F9I988_9ZZZZ